MPPPPPGSTPRPSPDPPPCMMHVSQSAVALSGERAAVWRGG